MVTWREFEKKPHVFYVRRSRSSISTWLKEGGAAPM